MKEFDFDSGRSKFKIKWQGVEHVCVCPSQKEVVEFGKEVEKNPEDADHIVKHGKLLLARCGMPEEVYDEMEPDQIRQIMDWIGQKKS